MERDLFELYLYVIKKLNIDPIEDLKSSLLLNEILKNKPLEMAIKEAEKRIKGKTALIVGAGPHVFDDLAKAERLGIAGEAVSIAADGASLAYEKHFNRPPDIIVTDLDGFPEEEVRMINERSLPFVHAHGDNAKRLVNFVPEMNWAIGTTQSFNLNRVFNFGGFTDGDRAVHIAISFGAEKIFLVGMDFGNVIGSYSNEEKYSKNKGRKLLKLKIGILMLERIAAKTKTPIINLSKGAVKITGIANV